MKNKNFDLTYYKNAEEGIHVQCIENSLEASKPHTHNYFQIYYISKGTLYHVTENGSLRLSRGDMFIIPPGRVHNIEKVEDALFYTFSFTAESLRPHGALSPVLHFLKAIEEDEVRLSVPTREEELLLVETVMEKMCAEFTERRVGYGEMLRSYAVVLLTVLARNYYAVSDSCPKASDSRSMILYALEYINENYTDALTLEEMCRRSAMSKSSFCKLFASVTGSGFKEYLNSCRIKGSLKYIKADYSIGAIYALVGYSDFSTFYRNFKRIMGCSPMEYKRCLR